MAEKITHSICVGGPIAVHTEDGVIRRIRPIIFDENDPKGWVIKARGQEFTPNRKTQPAFIALTEKKPCLFLRPYPLSDDPRRFCGDTGRQE